MDDDDQVPKSSLTSLHCEADDDVYRVDESKILAIAQTICEALGVQDHELSISLVGSETIRTLNREFRGKDRATDVLSFPQADFPLRLSTAQPAQPVHSPQDSDRPPPVLGDVVISLPEADLNAQKIGQGLDREVAFLLVHGILHLCGHDHEEPDDESAMLSEQQTIMQRLGDSWQRCVSSTQSARGGAL